MENLEYYVDLQRQRKEVQIIVKIFGDMIVGLT